MGQLFAPRAFGSKKCVVRAFVVRPFIHSFIQPCFSFSSAEASRNLGFLREIKKKLFFYRFNDRGAHLLTVDIWEQPLSVGPYIFSCEANEE